MKIILTIIFLLLLTGCSSEIFKSEPPVIENIGIIVPENLTSPYEGDPVFYEFGVSVEGPDGPKILPTFEFYVPKDTVVIAATSGIIDHIGYQEETEDYEIVIAKKRGVESFVVHDHVLNLEVSEGEEVTAGTKLGTVGTWTNEVGRTEIEVFYDNLLWCPLLFSNVQLRDEVTMLMQEIEAQNNQDFYDQEAMILPGCLFESHSG